MSTLICSPLRSASIAPVTRIAEAEPQFEFLDDRQRRYETITLCVHACDHDPAARRRRVDDVGDHALPSDRLEDHRAGRL
jgi:hypothetical protein